MIKYYILIAFLSVCNISKAQIAFTYDNAGNRVLRKTSGPLPVNISNRIQWIV